MNKTVRAVLGLFLLILFIIGGISVKEFKSINQFISEQDLRSSVPVISVSNPQSTSSALSGIDGERVKVSKVIDGDTIELSDGRKVRYIGIDTPETVDPRRPVECFGKQAKEENKMLVEGKEVILQKDVSETDKYDRLLRYVFLPVDNGVNLFVNDYLIREGFANILTYPPDVKYNARFLEAEKQAKNEKAGLWANCKG